MHFVVRYWSPQLPEWCREADGSPRLVDYSTHPPSRLGLHNALITLHDRIEILESHGGNYICEVFVVDGDSTQRLTQEMAESLFRILPNGEVKWTTISEFLLPQNRRAPRPIPADNVFPERQLPLFEYTHVPKDDADIPHRLDIDA